MFKFTKGKRVSVIFSLFGMDFILLIKWLR